MPAARKLPDDQTLRTLYQAEATTTSIAKQYGCSPGAVSLHWARLGLPARRERHDALLPWRVVGEFTHAIEPTYLRLLSRLAKGEHVRDRRAGSAYRWAKRHEHTHAIHYTAEGKGWAWREITEADTRVSLRTRLGPVVVALGSVPSQ